MKRLTATFERLAQAGHAAFMPFWVVGDPDHDASLEVCRGLIDAGADILELGFPFSDPPADGPVIQAADLRALESGTTPERAFEWLARLRATTEVPFTLLIYYNLILQYGVDAFYARCAEVGVEAVLVADLPLEEAAEALKAAERHSVAPIFIVSELTTQERLTELLGAARGYLYLVTHLGVTGARTSMAASVSDTIARIRPQSSLPILAGFGISRPEHVRTVVDAGADGAIVGSALIRQVTQSDDLAEDVGQLARALADAAHR